MDFEKKSAALLDDVDGGCEGGDCPSCRRDHMEVAEKALREAHEAGRRGGMIEAAVILEETARMAGAGIRFDAITFAASAIRQRIPNATAAAQGDKEP